MGFWKFVGGFAPLAWVIPCETKSRPMTDAEEKAFDKVFEKMGETFHAMDELFEAVARSNAGSSPPASGSTKNHDGTKGSS